MDYTVIHTNLTPNYNYLAAENAFLRQGMEYKNAVLCEQQHTISNLQSSISHMQSECEANKYDALRWQAMKKIITKQGGADRAAVVQSIVDDDIKNSEKNKRE